MAPVEEEKRQGEAERFDHMSPDLETRRRNEAAGHTLCEHCNGTGNELYSMYRACPECGGDGFTIKYGELSDFKRWRAERQEDRERKRIARKYRPPRDWKVEIAWRLSRWFGIGQCFHGTEECRNCGVWASDVDYEVRRVGPFRCECLDASGCRETVEENARCAAPTTTEET